MKKPEFRKRQAERSEKLATAWHEAEHCVVAQKYNLNASCLIYRLSDTSSDTRAYAGKTFFNFTTRLRKAVIGWGGLLSQYCKTGPITTLRVDIDNVRPGSQAAL